jgi:hypothetical protein
MDPQGAPVTYAVTCLYGLEPVLADEVHERLGAQGTVHWCEVVFVFDGRPARLRELRVAGNVFLLFDEFPIGHTVPDLDTLCSRLRSLPIEQWEESAREFREPSNQDISVSVRRRGEHNFTYEDVEERAVEVVAAATGRQVTLEPRPLELRIEIDGASCRLKGRLTPAMLSERPYRRYRVSGETDPALTAAMVRLSRPAPDDVFLDPFCGGGTIPIERALTGGAAAVVAGEVKENRIACAVGNARLADVPIMFGQWDASALPFADRTFTRLVTVPPQSDPEGGVPWRLDRFAGLLAECLRVLRHGGIMVCLMERGPLFGSALKHLSVTWHPAKLACNWKGRQWTIYTLEKTL